MKITLKAVIAAVPAPFYALLSMSGHEPKPEDVFVWLVAFLVFGVVSLFGISPMFHKLATASLVASLFCRLALIEHSVFRASRNSQ